MMNTDATIGDPEWLKAKLAITDDTSVGDYFPNRPKEGHATMNQSDDNTNTDGSNAVEPMKTTDMSNDTAREQPNAGPAADQEQSRAAAPQQGPDEGEGDEQPAAARSSFNVVRRASYMPGDTVVTRSNKNAYCGSIAHMDGATATVTNAFDLLGDSGLEVDVPTSQIVAAVEGEPRAIVAGDLDDLGAPQPGTDEE